MECKNQKTGSNGELSRAAKCPSMWLWTALWWTSIENTLIAGWGSQISTVRVLLNKALSASLLGKRTPPVKEKYTKLIRKIIYWTYDNFLTNRDYMDKQVHCYILFTCSNVSDDGSILRRYPITTKPCSDSPVSISKKLIGPYCWRCGVVHCTVHHEVPVRNRCSTSCFHSVTETVAYLIQLQIHISTKWWKQTLNKHFKRPNQSTLKIFQTMIWRELNQLNVVSEDLNGCRSICLTLWRNCTHNAISISVQPEFWIFYYNV